MMTVIQAWHAFFFQKKVNISELRGRLASQSHVSIEKMFHSCLCEDEKSRLIRHFHNPGAFISSPGLNSANVSALFAMRWFSGPSEIRSV